MRIRYGGYRDTAIIHGPSNPETRRARKSKSVAIAADTDSLLSTLHTPTLSLSGSLSRHHTTPHKSTGCSATSRHQVNRAMAGCDVVSRMAS